MPVTTRAATPADLPTLLTFEQGIVEAERPFDSTMKPDPISYYDVGELIESPDAHVVVAERDGSLVGSGFARKRASRHYTTPETHAYLGFMYVVPDQRGQGINQRILEDLLAWARENDLHEIRLTVYPGNQSAVRAYEKLGFVPHIVEMRRALDD